MSESDREKSPHYIPELDPKNPESGPKVKQRFLRFIVFCGLFFLGAGVALYFLGYEYAGLAAAGIGLVLLSPLLMFVGF